MKNKLNIKNTGKILMVYFLLLSLPAYTQTGESRFKAIYLYGITGQLNLRGNYRESELNFGNEKIKQSENYLDGIMYARTQGFIVHPNFMFFNINGTFNAESRRAFYIGAPDFSEKTNSEGFDASALFFQKKKYNFNTNASYNSSIQNIDNLTRSRVISKLLGASFNYYNDILPFNVSYSHQKIEESTIGTNRSYNLDQRNFQAMANKSFSPLDHSTISYMHTENKSTQKEIGNIIPFYFLNKVDMVEMENSLFFDQQKKYNFTSIIVNSHEKGYVIYNRIYGQQNLNLILPKHLTLFNYFNWGQNQQEGNKVNNMGFENTLTHQLFQSLNSSLVFEHIQVDQKFFEEKSNNLRLDLRYTKAIPTGKLNLNYAIYKEFQTTKTPSTAIDVIREQYTLDDNQITFLKNENVQVASVVVRDATGAIIYQLNVDYLLIEQKPYIEIKRIPGGLIANNSNVSIDYTTIKPDNYEYEMNGHSFGVSAIVFQNKLNMYYRWYNQDFNNVTGSYFLTLNYYTRQIMGFALDFSFIKGGVEYEKSKSSLVPFKSMRYFLVYQKVFRLFSFGLTGNLLDYQMENEQARRKDYNASAKIAYVVSRRTKMNFDYMYRTLHGGGINLELHTSKLEITTTIHKLYFTVGTEYYWNKNESSQSQFRQAYILLTRNF
jgi:hypothetical protein